MADWKNVRDLMNSRIPEGMEVVPVVGVSFIEDYPTNLHRLAIAHTHRKEDIKIGLTRNPDNPFDGNAVEVRYMGHMVGHLSREVAARIAPRMDKGEEIKAYVFLVRISPENPSNPGLDVLLDQG